MIQLGAQMYTLREYTKTAEGLREALHKVKDMGYQAVQLSGHGADIAVEQAAEYLQETGLQCAATHISFEEMQDDLAAVVKKHRAWNCQYAGVGSMPGKYRGSAEGFRAFAKDASQVAKALADEGLHFIYHNHHFEFEKFDGKLGYEILLEESAPQVQFELDTFWVQTGGGDVVDWIKRLQGRMDVVHFKDMAIDGQAKQIMAEIGQGNLNWDGIIQACRSIGVKWYLVEQDVCQRSPFESLDISRRFLNGKGIA